MTPQQHREHAAELILDAARNGERLSVSAHLLLAGVRHTPADCDAIEDLIHTATITVDFPGETPDA